MLYMKGVKRANLKSFHHKGKNIFFNFVYM